MYYISMFYDLIIIGGGPAGVAAGIYASRKKIKALLITDSFGGQAVISDTINNFIGYKSISGVELKNKLEEQLRGQSNLIDIKEGTKIEKIEKKDGDFSVITDKGETIETKTILIAMGSSPRRLNVPGEAEFAGKGVFYCTICDAPLMNGKAAAVVGGGNSGLESVIDLLPYADKIYLFEYSENLKGDPIYVDKIKNSGKVEIHTMAAVKEILGEKFVSGLKYEDRKTGEIKEIKLNGVFISIGYRPNSDLVKDLVKLNEKGEIVVNHQTQQASLEGIWAAGDIADSLYNQISVAIGDAVKAVLNIYDFLIKKTYL